MQWPACCTARRGQPLATTRPLVRLSRHAAPQSRDALAKSAGFPIQRLSKGEVVDQRDLPPILRNKHYTSGSAFTPESVLREARRDVWHVGLSRWVARMRAR